jgi:predicted ATPase
MLTRIEIDGFKTFEAFELDLAPFLVILGPNASGKSNLFDAVRFLSNLAAKDLRQAVQDLRGEAHEIFRTTQAGAPGTRIDLAVEVLVEPSVRDPWGTQVSVSHTRMRYEVTIERRVDPKGIERLVVSREEARPILVREDPLRSGAWKVSDSFRDAHLKYARRTPWLATTDVQGRPVFQIHQDGKAGRTRPGDAAEATVLSSITTNEFPHLFALREELRSWRFLQLDPTFLRRPSPITAPELLEPDGSNLAAVLARIKHETADRDHPKGVLAQVAAELAQTIPGVVDFDVAPDPATREYRFDLQMRDGVAFSSRVISDGTLRVLALLTLLHDPKHRGLVCFEEPENGVHPARLRTLVQRLRALVTDPTSEAVPEAGPLTQLLLNSHSPVVLAALRQAHAAGPGAVVFADLVSVTDPKEGKVRRKTRIRPIRRERQRALLPDDAGGVVGEYEVEQFLSTVDREG